MKKKAPVFFCDNCGAKVSGDVKACPGCGRFFVSVRCPACGFSGEERIFAKGCPSCGYSAPSPRAHPPAAPKKDAADPLPFWVYLISVAALLLVLVILLSVLSR